jgi:thioredoxin-related protein
MKRFLFLSLFILPFLSMAQVEFSTKSTWEEIRNNAANTGKFIFIDAYTDWCGWCKVMDKNTFSQPTVAEMMNDNFVNYKIEMEKEELGKMLAMKYGIRSFPSFIILNKKGELHAILGGYSPPEEWMKSLEETLNKETPERLAISNTLEVKWPSLYSNYFGYKIEKRSAPSASELDAYFSENQSLDEVYFRMTMTFMSSLPSKTGNDLLSRGEEMTKLFGRDLAEEWKKNWLTRNLSASKIKGMSLDELNAELQSYEEYYPEDTQTRIYTTLNFQLIKEDYPAAVEWVNEHEPVLGNGTLNRVSWNLYEKSDDQMLLQTANRWMKKVVDSEPTYSYLDTQAALLYKTNDNTKAAEVAKQAIRVGKEAGENVAETEALLEKIQSAQ